VLPGNRSVNWFESGMWVNPKGELAVSVVNSAPRGKRTRGVHGVPQAVEMRSLKFIPEIYPGRYRCCHVDERVALEAADTATGQPPQ
jgi:hypothetical protein